MNNLEMIEAIETLYIPKPHYELREALCKSVELLKLDIVRCSECKNCELREGFSDRYICTRWNNSCSIGGFCNYGKR